jgi:hypothetical protein
MINDASTMNESWNFPIKVGPMDMKKMYEAKMEGRIS